MTTKVRELAAVRKRLGPRYYNRLIANFRGLGIQGRGSVSGGRGIEAGSAIPGSEVVDDFNPASTTNYRPIDGSGNTRFDTSAYGESYGWRTDGPHPVATNIRWASQLGDGLLVYPVPGNRLLVLGRGITRGGSAEVMFPAHGQFDTYRACFKPETIGAIDVSAGVSKLGIRINVARDMYELVTDWIPTERSTSWSATARGACRDGLA